RKMRSTDFGPVRSGCTWKGGCPCSSVMVWPTWKSIMKPSSLRTWATRCLSLVLGMATAGRSMRLPLGMCVSMSASGAVIMGAFLSAARLRHAGNEPVAGHVAEADAANAKFAVHRPRASAQPAAQPDADLVARPHLRLVGLPLAELQRGHLLFVPGD